MKKQLHTLLIITALLCVIFGGYNYYTTVLNPSFSHTIKCEGIILDSSISYHLTDKNSLDELRKIRGNEVAINEKDIILHYRDRDMEKISPSYWGTFSYDSKWNFRLDKSFSTDANALSNILLPFLSEFNTPWYNIFPLKNIPLIGKYFYTEQHFVKPGQVLNENELTRLYYFNTVAGDKSSRFYLQIKSIKGKYILPWFDNGVKTKYLINTSRNDTIGIFFNQKNAVLANKNFAFDNSSADQGSYYLLFNPNSETKFSLMNLNNKILLPIDGEYFEVGNMIFRINHVYTLFQKVMLTLYLCIIVCSLLFFFRLSLNDGHFLFATLNRIRICVLCFYLLGFPILAIAIETQNFGWKRELLLTSLVPAIPFLSSSFFLLNFKNSKIGLALTHIYTPKKRILKNLFNNKVIRLTIALFVFSLLFTASNGSERVIGIPVLNYVKLILMLCFYFIYSEAFANQFKKISHLFNPKLVVFFKSTIVLCITILTSIITSDYGISALIFFALLIFEYINWNIPIKLFGVKFGLPGIIALYVFTTLLLLPLCHYLDDPGKIYRLTYSWLNPGHTFYTNISQAHRESISILFHNIKIIYENPLGIHNLSIPPASKSVSHTDFAIAWSLMQNGAVFLVLLLLVLFNFIVHSLIFANCIYRLDANGNSLTNISTQSKAFTTFLLIFTIVQCIAPIFSNLLLPGSFLTGVPFLGISISIGDSIFLAILFVQMERIKSAETTFLSVQTKADLLEFSVRESKNFAKGVMILIITFMLFKVIAINFQDDQTHIKSKDTKTALDTLPLHLSTPQIILATQTYFAKKDITTLNSTDKASLKRILIQYYQKREKKLSNQLIDFNLTKDKELKRISLDSSDSFCKYQVSKSKWKGAPVFAKNVLINGNLENYITNEYFENIDFHNSHLDIDVTAILNRIIKQHLTEGLKNYKNLVASILITQNETGNIIANSSYPFISKHPEVEFSFYPGSTKKILLAHYFSKHHNVNVNDKLFKASKAPTPLLWVGKSDNEATEEVFKEYVELEKFKIFLATYQNNFPFISTISKNGYAEHGWNDNKKAIINTIIGSRTKYSALQINNWFRLVANDAFRNNRLLFQMLNAPFFVSRGTATMVENALTKEDIDYTKLICKTGTLEENNRNLSTAFGISNKEYTITILIDGIQPDNQSRLAAKHLFIKCIPEIKDYLQSK